MAPRARLAQLGEYGSDYAKAHSYRINCWLPARGEQLIVRDYNCTGWEPGINKLKNKMRMTPCIVLIRRNKESRRLCVAPSFFVIYIDDPSFKVRVVVSDYLPAQTKWRIVHPYADSAVLCLQYAPQRPRSVVARNTRRSLIAVLGLYR